jgi:hypothetical protein
MFHYLGRRRRGAGAVLSSLGATLALLFVACNGPQSPAPDPNGGDVEATWRAGALEFHLVSGNAATPLVLVASAFDFDAATNHLSAQVAIRNDGSEPVPGPQTIIVFGFVPATVVPVNAVCEGDVPTPGLGGCVFDHRGTYGDDGLLAPGETSTPVQWILFDPNGESFAFRAQLGPPETGPGSIAGVVFEDADRNNVRAPGEAGVPGVTVRLRGGASELTTSTAADGRYAFTVAEAGIYSLDVVPPLPGDRRPTAPLPLVVTIVRRTDGSLTQFALADIGIAAAGNDAAVRIDGRVFEDANRNGRFDDGERGIAGVTIKGRAGEDDDDDKVTLDDDDEDEVRAVSDAEGLYALVLPGGTGPWEVRAESIDGYDRTTPKHVSFVVPPAAGEALHADFGFAREEAWSHYEVEGTVFLDSNRNGRRDDGETGIAAVLVRADGTACDGLSTASDATNSHGKYTLEGADVHCALPWMVTRSALPGYDSTSPDSVQLDGVPAHGETFKVDFGVIPQPPGR